MFKRDFEVHLTGSEWEADQLAAFAAQRGAKFSHIVLDGGGATPLQPMVTITGTGTLAELQERAEQWRTDLESADLHVLRVKIEAAPWNEDVPRTDEAANEDRYFEHHVKVLLKNHSEWPTLNKTVTPRGARPSRNARRKRDDGQEELFVHNAATA